MIKLTEAQVRRRVKDYVKSIKDEFRRGHYDKETNRETLIERMDEDCDTIWGNLVMGGRIAEYDVDDMVATAAACAVIIKVAEADAWVETDNGLWEGMTYGLIACIAFYSFRNLLYNALKNAGMDTNEEYPFENLKIRPKKAD